MTSPLKLELNLQEISMTRVAISCWEERKIKNEINEFFLSNSVNSVYFHVEKKLRDWTDDVVNYFVDRRRTLPKSLRHQMTHIIISVGRRMIRWLKHKVQSPMLQYYLDNIHWTTYGTIDEVKVFKALCNNPKITDFFYLYEEACSLCLADDAKNLWEKFNTEQRDYVFKRVDPESWRNQLNRLESFHTYLLIYWLRSDRENHLFTELSLPSKYDRIYDFGESARVNHFRLSVDAGYEAAARHFFDELTDEEKTQNLVKTAVMLVKRRLNDSAILTTNLSSAYYYIKHVDILIFLLQKISTFQNRHLYTRCAINILEGLLFLWPWQNLFIAMVKQLASYLRFFDYQKLLSTIIERIIYEAEVICDIEKFRIYQILLEMWSEVPVNFKVQMVEDSSLLFCELPSKIGNLSFLKHVADDPDLASKREELLTDVKNYFHELFIEGKQDVVDSILREVFSYTQQECVNFKRTLDNSEVCKHFLSQCLCDNLDEFLMWQFESQEEVDQFKTDAKSNNLNVSILCHIWNFEDLSWSQNLMEDFFEFFMYDETDKKNLREQLLNSEEFKTTLMNFVRNGRNNKLEGFMNCCQFSEEEICQVKNQCSA